VLTLPYCSISQTSYFSVFSIYFQCVQKVNNIVNYIPITVALSPPSRTIYLWSQTDFNLIRQNIQSLYWYFVTTHSVSTPVNTLWNDFMSICNTCMDQVPSRITSTKYHQPWITNHIKRLTHRKQRAYNHVHATNTVSDWARYKDIKKLC